MSMCTAISNPSTFNPLSGVALKRRDDKKDSVDIFWRLKDNNDVCVV